MPFNRATLEAAIAASDGAEQSSAQVGGLLAKLQALDAVGCYGQLLKAIARANDKNNFLALVLEATFAHQFEAQGISLDYEVKQEPASGSSIDFGMRLDEGQAAYFELRLLQQDRAIAQSIEQQLEKTGAYAVALGGGDEQRAVLKVQSTVLSKVEDKDGRPVKFLKVDDGALNIVVVCISDIMGGTADLYDCILATYGDPEVPAICRRQVFGLFQDVQPDYPEHVQKAAARFAHIKATLHGVLFLFREKEAGPLDYPLEQVLVWNRALTSKETTRVASERIYAAIPPLKRAAASSSAAPVMRPGPSLRHQAS